MEIVELIALCALVVGGIIAIIIAIVRGEMKKFVEEKMAEAETIYRDEPKPNKSKLKREYVLSALKEKYKVLELLINAKAFIEKVIELTKKININ